MKENIPLDGTNVDDPMADKDGLSLLIMRQAFLDALSETDDNAEYTQAVTEKETEE